MFPETCENLEQVIYSNECVRKNNGPTVTYNTTRTMDEIVKLAQIYGVKLSFVIPYKISNESSELFNQSARDRVANIAYSTGGEYAYYDKSPNFNTVLLHEALELVINKQKHSLIPLVNNNKSKIAEVHKDEGTILDVSTSGVNGSSYKWDFNDDGTWDETSLGPVIETTFENLGTAEFRVQALSEQGEVLGEARQAYNVTQPEVTDSKPLPNTPEGVTAHRLADGSVRVEWGEIDGENLMISEATESMPLAIAPADIHQIVVNTNDNELTVTAIGDTSVSEPATVPIAPYQAESNTTQGTQTNSDAPVTQSDDTNKESSPQGSVSGSSSLQPATSVVLHQDISAPPNSSTPSPNTINSQARTAATNSQTFIDLANSTSSTNDTSDISTVAANNISEPLVELNQSKKAVLGESQTRNKPKIYLLLPWLLVIIAVAISAKLYKSTRSRHSKENNGRTEM